MLILSFSDLFDSRVPWINDTLGLPGQTVDTEKSSDFSPRVRKGVIQELIKKDFKDCLAWGSLFIVGLQIELGL